MCGQRVSPQVKGEILRVIAQAQERGVGVSGVCQMLQLSRSRYYAWKQRVEQAEGCGVGDPDPLVDRPPGPAAGEAPHRLLDEEKEKVSVLLKEEAYADLSPRQLAVVASEEGLVQVSASSFYRQARKEALVREKEVKTPVKKQEKPDVCPAGPNQVWSWDISYIPFFGIYLYFIAVIDVYSRKIVGWKLSFHATVEVAKQAWDKALCNEGLMNVQAGPMSLKALSDHGSQMTARSMAQFFKDLGIAQLFARYQTPTDNAWIEAFFRIFKYDWLRFQDIFSFHQLERLIASFIDYYNSHRYHGAIGYVTPHQKHTGQDQQVLKARQQRKEEARQRRLEVHRQQASQDASRAA